MLLCGLLLFILIVGLASGYPVALVLGGGALLTAFLAIPFGYFDPTFLHLIPERVYGIINNESLIAVALFVLMGNILEKSKVASDLLESMGLMMGGRKLGLSLSVFIVGALLAASTGIVGATVVTMGLISLPSLLKKGVPGHLSSGIVAASGTLGQIIPPSIVLIVLGDVISTANQQAQIDSGIFNTSAVSVGDLFKGALLPGLLLVLLYMVYVSAVLIFNKTKDQSNSSLPQKQSTTVSFKLFASSFVPPLILIVCVLGSILMGFATPTEAASVGCAGALLTALIKRRLTYSAFKSALEETAFTTSMIFLILISANILSVVFRGFGGDEIVSSLLEGMGHQPALLLFVVMMVIFFLGFFLDFFEITFVVIPLVGPTLIKMGFDPVWLGVMIAMNLQTSFLTPPFGFSLFYLRGVAPENISTHEIYKGVIPFIAIQIAMLLLLWFFPWLVL